MARYLVTGATGFIGGVMIRQLVAAGHTVVAVVRDPARAGALAAQGVELHRGDVTARTTLAAPMRGADGVFHVAGWYKLGVRDASEGERINVDGTRNVLEVMRDLGIAKGVYTSTLAVYGDTRGQVVEESYGYAGPFQSAYDLTKYRAHREVAEPLMQAGLPLVVVQPGLVYGPGDTSSVRTTLHQFLRGTLPLVPARTAFSWAHVDDIVSGHVLAMERGRVGQSYHLAGPVHTLEDALALCTRLTGVKGPGLVAPPALLRGLAALLTPFEGLLEGQYHPENLRVTGGSTYIGSAAKAIQELGWSARSLEAGMRETLRHEIAALGLPLTVR